MSFLSRSFLFFGSSLVVGALGACDSTTAVTPPDVVESDAPASDASENDAPTSDVSPSDVPAVDRPASDAAASDAPAADRPAGDVTTSDVTTSDVAASDRPATDGSAVDATALDSGVHGCASARDCVSGREECVFPEAMCAAAGHCTFISDCAAIADYCSCAGETFRDCPGRPTRPNAGRGACAGVDGGTADASPSPDSSACAGASIGRGGGYCAGPADAPLPISCCTGWVCDGRVVLCDARPPTCPGGYVPSVVSACWGPCVPAANCARFACGDSPCPQGFRCNPSSLECDPAS